MAHRLARLASLLLFCLPALASAQDAPSASVMVVGGTVGVDAQAWLDAVDAVEARLREAGFRIDDTGLPRRDDCAALSCLEAERASRGIDVLVTVTLFVAEGSRDQVGSVVVTMVDAEAQYVGEEAVDGRVVGTVAALALSEARSARERGAEPWLRVVGTPAGAVVVLDGRDAGVVPFEERVSAGEHELEVRLSGHRPHHEHVTLRRGHTEEIAVSLVPEAGSADRTASLVTGIGLLAAGAVLAGVGIANAAQIGSCDGAAPCREHVVFGATEGVLFGVGGAALIGGAILVITQPF